MLETDVYERTKADAPIVSDATYNLIIGLVLCWGFLINWLLVRFVDPTWLLEINKSFFMIVYFASCFYGVHLFNNSKDPAISFIGYNFVVVPFGLVVNLVVSRYEPTLVLEAIRITAGVTVVMTILGALYPLFFRKLSVAMMVMLLAVIVVELVQIYVFNIHHIGIDFAVAIIFCGYIAYDWGRANQIPKTIDNAVDSAAALYMDIINLFLRVLRILGRRRR